MSIKSILFFSFVEDFVILFCALSIINKWESAHATPAENRIHSFKRILTPDFSTNKGGQMIEFFKLFSNLSQLIYII